MYQEMPTVIYQDNESAIKIANNRGSLGQTSRAMDLRTLSCRNRIEDYEVSTKFKGTVDMIADMGTKALPSNPFVRFRDTMNGYALVKAAYPEMNVSDLVYNGEENDIGFGLKKMQSLVMMFQTFGVDDFPDSE
jgi:hypothetical protein